MEDVDLSSVARLIGDPSRATMLAALLAGRALTVGELGRIAGIKPPAASAHLAKLLDGGIVAIAAQGRHRYFRLAGPDIAHVLESLSAISGRRPVRSLRASAAARALRPARMCYDHLAGVLGVRIHDHLVEIGTITVSADGIELTVAGESWFHRADVDPAVEPSRRPLVRQCLDWTERRPHLAGALPARLATAFLERGWLVRRAEGERGLTISLEGSARIAALLDVQPAQLIA